ncbi:MAG: HAMP domain-containing histidine kinase [Candidatus Thiodiazotropha taylori]|nr:HAMP domain-containing histidine kinase [Candidatus Thiodiazotropha endolucinida]MCW4228503.1 HAMP domain-containing histidine kinase [Candidatus Thiodiazotropha taylori]
MKDQKEISKELEETLASLTIGMTQLEVMGLMVHDLGHRAMHALNEAESLANKLKKSYRRGMLNESLDDQAQRSIDACVSIVKHVSDIANITRLQHGKKRNINIANSIREVLSKFDGTFFRYNMSASVETDVSNMHVYGSEQIFEQIISQLILNSIEAQRGRSNARENDIQIKVSKKKDGCVIQYSDNGPGIDRSIFQNPSDIFTLGATSKPYGTGRGLSICRNLLSVYFSGNVALTSSKPAIFRIQLPLAKVEKSE